MTSYRKIYEQHYGLIPVESDGRTYEIHHIDGDHSNNTLENLKAVTIQEHYDMHFSQGDWAACQAIAMRLTVDPEDFKSLNARRIADGTHNFLGGEIQRLNNKKRVLNGTHHLLKRTDGTSIVSGQVAKGTHNFCGENNPSKNMPKLVCPYCLTEGGRSIMKRWHFDNCKKKLS